MNIKNIISILTLLSFNSFADDNILPAKVVAHKGNGTITKEAESEVAKLESGVRFGDVLFVSDQSIVRIALADASRVVLQPESSIKINQMQRFEYKDRAEEKTELDIKSGSFGFVGPVVKEANLKKEVLIHTGKNKIKTSNANFSYRSLGEDKANLIVLDGTMSVVDAGGDETIVNAGQMTSIVAGIVEAPTKASPTLLRSVKNELTMNYPYSLHGEQILSGLNMPVKKIGEDIVEPKVENKTEPVKEVVVVHKEEERPLRMTQIELGYAYLHQTSGQSSSMYAGWIPEINYKTIVLGSFAGIIYTKSVRSHFYIIKYDFEPRIQINPKTDFYLSAGVQAWSNDEGGFVSNGGLGVMYKLLQIDRFPLTLRFGLGHAFHKTYPTSEALVGLRASF